MVRGPFYDKNGVKKGAWSREEDDKLRAYIQRYGHSNWRQLPKSAGLARCGKSCRLRWMNYLRPDLIHGNFSNEEEELIIKLRQKHGNKWSLIAEKLPGRSDNDIKNHWHSHLKKSLKRNDTKPELKSEPSEHTESGRPSHVLVGAETECHHILESSSALPLSTETSYTQENCSSFTSNSNDAESSMKWSREEDSVVSWELLQELSSDDFWSRPFLVENTTTYDDSVPIFSYLYEGTDLSDLRGILDW